MSDMKYVGPKAAEWAGIIEGRFRKLPPSAGIIFLSVKATPGMGGITKHFTIVLGLEKRLSESAGFAIIDSVMEKELKLGTLDIGGAVFIGLSGAYRDQSSKELDSIARATNDSI